MDNGFALTSSVSGSESESGLNLKVFLSMKVSVSFDVLLLSFVQVRFQGSSNLWGIRELASRRSLVFNDYGAMTLCSFMRASGHSVHYKSKLEDTFIEHYFFVT